MAAVAAGAMVVSGLAACGSSASSRATPPVPTLGVGTDVYNGDVGDPFVLTATGVLPPGSPRYVVFGTDDWPDRIPTATSGDLVAWTHGPDAFPVLPSWAAPDPRNDSVWAPAVVALAPQRYVMYVTVPDAASHRQCLATATATTALGPYTNHSSGPLVCQAALGGSIDASVATDGSTRVLVWKTDGNAIGQPGALWAQTLSADGLAVTGHPHRLLTADRPWQAGIVEGPSLLKASKGGWWLWYSGNSFDRAAYATGVAYCPTLTEACRETSAGPVLATAAGQSAPGGLETFRAANGQLFASFATWSRPARRGVFYCCRALDLAPVTSH